MFDHKGTTAVKNNKYIFLNIKKPKLLKCFGFFISRG